MKNWWEFKIQNEAYLFAGEIIEVYSFLASRKEYILSKQLLRSGTSIWANVEEAQFAVSKKDFINKMAIAWKEARETLYWLRLLRDKWFLSEYPRIDVLFESIKSIANVIGRIVLSSKETVNM